MTGGYPQIGVGFYSERLAKYAGALDDAPRLARHARAALPKLPAPRPRDPKPPPESRHEAAEVLRGLLHGDL